MSRAAGALPAAVVAGLALDSGGYFPRAWVWSSVVLLWLTALVLVLGGRVVLDRRGALYLGAAAALTAWTLLSRVWSVAAGQSVLDARRNLVFLAGAAAVLVLGRRQTPGVLAAAALAAVVGLARYLTSGPTGGVEQLLLSWPIGYANAFAALAAIALPIALATASRDVRLAARAAAAAAVPLFLAVLVFTSSRGGVAAALVALAGLAALDTRRRGLAATAVRLAPAAALALVVSVGADLTGATSHLDLRRGVVAAALLVSAAAAALAVRRASTVPPGRPFSATVAVGAVAAAVVVAVVLSAFAGAGSQRTAYWRLARHVVAAHPVLGAGAASFGPEWYAYGPVERYGGALDAHNLYLETLAELGPAGLALLLVFLAVPLAAARSDAVAAAAYVAFLAHALLDWDWEMPAVTLAAVLVGGSLLLPQRGRVLSERRRQLLAAAAVALALAALAGLRSDAVPGALHGALHGTAAWAAAPVRRAT